MVNKKSLLSTPPHEFGKMLVVLRDETTSNTVIYLVNSQIIDPSMINDLEITKNAEDVISPIEEEQSEDSE